MSFTNRLRERLLLRMGSCPTCGAGGMSQREMCRQLGAHPATICRFLAGKAPSAALVDKLVEFLGPESEDVPA